MVGLTRVIRRFTVDAKSSEFTFDPLAETLEEYTQRTHGDHRHPISDLPDDSVTVDVYNIENLQGGNELDVNGQVVPNVAVCSNQVATWCSQYWRIVPGQAGYYLIQSVATDLCVQMLGQNQQCGFAALNIGDNTQNWKFVTDDAFPGHWLITNKQNPNLALDLDHGRGGNSVPVYSFDYNGDRNQKWMLFRVGAYGDRIPAPYAAVVAQYRLKCASWAGVYRADKSYTYLADPDVTAIWSPSYLNPAQPNHVPYVDEVFDCDDFAATMRALTSKWGYDNRRSTGAAVALGTAWTSIPAIKKGHAFNFYLSQGWYLKLFEPQTGEEYQLANSERAYMIMF
jgi:hypothetical protein